MLFAWHPAPRENALQSTAYVARGTFRTYHQTLAWALRLKRIPATTWLLMCQDREEWRRIIKKGSDVEVKKAPELAPNPGKLPATCPVPSCEWSGTRSSLPVHW